MVDKIIALSISSLCINIKNNKYRNKFIKENMASLILYRTTVQTLYYLYEDMYTYLSISSLLPVVGPRPYNLKAHRLLVTSGAPRTEYLNNITVPREGDTFVRVTSIPHE